MKNTVDERIEGFLQRVERQIYTEDSANDISEELNDHIECLLEDYKEAGLDQDHAVSKALLQMGDPKEIGYAFTDYEAMKKRNQWLLFFKFSSIAMLVLTFLPMILRSDGGGSFSFELSEVASLLPNILNVWLAIFTGSMILGHSTKWLDLDTDPFAIIWPVKERFKWEYLLLSIFFLPLACVFLFVYFYEEGVSTMSFLAMWPLVTFLYAGWAFWFKEKFRFPKVMIVSEGFIIKGRFVSWTGIESYTWSKDFWAKDQDNYKLVLNTFSIYNGQRGYRRNISVNQRQYAYINEYLRARI